MKIGIICYSFTGHTREVAMKLLEGLKDKFDVALETVKVADDKENNPKKIQFTVNPGIEHYDVLILAGPVQGFQLCLVMKSYLRQFSSFSNQKIFAFTTMFFPFKWSGGNQAIKWIKKQTESHGGTFIDSQIIHWSKKNKDIAISEMIKRFRDKI